jgi:hypothetical protein
MKSTIHLDLEFHPFNMDETDHMKNLVIWMKWIPILFCNVVEIVFEDEMLYTNGICHVDNTFFYG